MQLVLDGITKSYTKGKKRKNALEDFSLTMTEGVYGLLGPNGAGKSTLINIITGIISRDSGSIAFDNNGNSDFVSHLGFMPQGMDFYRNFTAKDYIKYIMALKKFSTDNDNEYALDILTRVNLRNDADKKIGAFSGGMKQRLGIAQAIVGNPKILIFDEPTAGQDRKSTELLGAIVAGLAKKGKIVITITHDMEFVVKYFKRVIVMAEKKKRRDASPREIFWDEELLRFSSLKQPYLCQLANMLGHRDILTIGELLEVTV